MSEVNPEEGGLVPNHHPLRLPAQPLSGVPEGAGSSPSALGSLVYCRYRDHSYFERIDPSRGCPVILEVVGWLTQENRDSINLVFERIAMPTVPKGLRRFAKGWCILKSTIIELRKINTPSLKSSAGGKLN
jgi:hypothetical protein